MSRHSIKDDRWHILHRTAMYLGSTETAEHTEYIVDDKTFNTITLSYVPALKKMIDEIIDNSVDALKDMKRKGSISVDIDKFRVKVTDNGDGIPVSKIKDLDGSDVLIPFACWGKAKSGSNFNDDEVDSTTIGTNGVGSHLTNVLSVIFEGITCDGTLKYTGKWSSNASDYTETITESSKKGTSVMFEPDFKRFNITEISSELLKSVEQRLINLSVSYPNIKFAFNKKVIKYKRMDLIQMLGNHSNIYETDKYILSVLPSDDDDFKSFSIINGLNIKSGNHIDYILKQVVNAIKDKLPKKYKEIKYGDIKNKLQIGFIGSDFPKIKWESQTKETLKNSDKEVSTYLGNDWKDIIKDIIKNKEIIDRITTLYDAKLDAEARKALKDLDKPKKEKPKSEKFMPPIGEWTNVWLAEGDSAANSVSKILGRQGNGFFAMFGVPPNAYKMKLSEITKSKKMIELREILGFSYTKEVQTNINFKNIIITTDFDLPGHFITGQLLGLFYRFGKNLFEEGRIKRFITPLVLVTDKKENIVTWFYSFDKYKEHSKKFGSKYTYDYKKGLGSWDAEELQYIINKEGIDRMLETYTLDDLASESLDNWLSSDKTDIRKELLNNSDVNVTMEIVA